MKCILKIGLILGSFFFYKTSFSQIKTYQFDQIESLQKLEPKKCVVFIYTDWCKYCEMMKNTTFLNQTIIKELNDNFYFISLNAEENESINFNGQTFEFKPTGPDTGVHELALELGSIDNQLTFPTICFLNKGNEIIYQLNQYAKTEELIVILNQLK